MTRSFCSYFNQGSCRSCGWLDLDYLSQIQAKEDLIRSTLRFLSPESPLSLEKSALSCTEGFRNRAKMSITGSLDHPLIGIVGEENLDEGQDLRSCPVHHPKLNEVIQALPEWIQSHRLFPYQIGEKTGELKGIIAFYSPISRQMYLRFILRSKECVSRIRKLTPVLQERFPFVVCISANIQPVPHAILEGPEEIFLTSRTSIDHLLGGITFKLHPQAFVQTNVEVATALYQTLGSWVEELKPKKMLDLFCGQGAFSFFSARGAGEILGIEINPEAVITATESAQKPKYSHLRFIQADARKAGLEINRFQPDLILVNPPRKGMADGMSLIDEYSPEHFFYSSCSIDSLARDLVKLATRYRVRKVQLFDLFPHTSHFETLIWLERELKNP